MNHSTSPERVEQIRRLFDEVVDLSAQERIAYLDKACEYDPDLHREVEFLLEAYDDPDSDIRQALEQLAKQPSHEGINSDPYDLSGRSVSHFQVMEKVGSGGMGVVYKARDTRLDRTVALKFLPPHLDFDEDVRARFIQEAKAASALDHPNICTIHDIEELEDGRIFIAMSCYDGETLKDKIARGPLPLEEALDYSVQIAEGLSLAHEGGIVHRDIKPGNVMVTDRGVVKILDFGLAKMAETTLTKTIQALGTAAYMSPEQARGEAVDHRTDIWSLGVVFYEMLTGERPFQGDYEQAVIYSIVNVEQEPIHGLRPDIPEKLEEVVALTLAKKQEDRYQDLEMFLRDLAETRAAASINVKNWKRLAIMALVILVVSSVAYGLVRSSSPYASYERAYYEARYEEASEKSMARRTLEDVKAHTYFLRSTYYINDYELPDGIKQEYRVLLKEHPESPEAHFYLGLAYMLSGTWRAERDSAWLLIDRASEMGLLSPYVDLEKNALLQRLNLTAHILEKTEDLKVYTDNPSVLYDVAYTYERLANDTVTANRYYKEALKSYPEHIRSYLRLSNTALENNDFDLARRYIDQANEINNRSALVTRAYALFFEKEGRFDESEKYYLQAINEFGGSDAGLFFSLAKLYLDQDKIDEGLAFTEAALENFPGDFSLLSLSSRLKFRERWLEMEAQSQSDESLINWIEDFELGRRIAEREGKPLLVDFYAPWCFPCKKMDEETYPDPDIQTALASFVPIKINAEVEPALAEKYEVKAFPTVVVIAVDGEKVFDKVGYEQANEFVQTLQEGLLAHTRYVRGQEITQERLSTVTNFDDAKILAQSKSIPIMAVVSSEQSEWSNKLLSETIDHPALQAGLTNIVFLSLDRATSRSQLLKWGVMRFPTILFFDKNGDLLFSQHGYQPPEILADLIEEVKNALLDERKPESGINWFYNLEEAKSIALAQQNSIFVTISAEWCPPCTWLEENTFTAPPVIEVLQEKFISVYLDEIRDEDIIHTIGTNVYPTLVVLDASGEELFRTTGYKRPDELLEWLKLEEKLELISVLGAERYRDFQGREELAKSLSRQRLFASAVAMYQEQVEILPDHADIYLELANLYRRWEKPEEAIQYYRAAVEAGSAINDGLVESVVDTYLQAQDVKGLMTWFEQTIQKVRGENEALAALYLGNSECLYILQDRDQALQKARMAVQYQPDQFKTRLQLGRLLYLLDQLPEAEQNLKKAMMLDKQDPEACFYLGLVAEQSGNPVEQEKYFDLARNRSGWAAGQVSWRVSYFNRPNYHVYPGYLEMIEQGLRYAVMLEPDDANSKGFLAYVLAIKNNHLDEALELIDSVLSDQPDNTAALDTKIWVLYRMGEFEEAQVLTGQLIKLVSTEQLERQSEYGYHIGATALAVGDTTSAKTYLEKSLINRDPSPLEVLIQESARSLLASLNTN